MANRLFRKDLAALEQGLVHLYLKVVVGASGAVTSFEGKGVKSVVKESAAGRYTITLEDSYPEILHVSLSPLVASPATGQGLLPSVASISSSSVVVQLLDDASVAANLPSAAQLLVEIKLKNSSV